MNNNIVIEIAATYPWPDKGYILGIKKNNAIYIRDIKFSYRLVSTIELI